MCHLSIFHNNKIKIKQIYKLYPKFPGIKFGGNRMLLLVHQQNSRGWISPHPVQRCVTASSCLKLPPADLVHCAAVITNTLQSLLLMGQHFCPVPPCHSFSSLSGDPWSGIGYIATAFLARILILNFEYSLKKKIHLLTEGELQDRETVPSN